MKMVALRVLPGEYLHLKWKFIISLICSEIFVFVFFKLLIEFGITAIKFFVVVNLDFTVI